MNTIKENDLKNTILKYLQIHENKLIGISSIAKHCNKIKGEIYSLLYTLQREGRVNIIKKYLCPNNHSIEYSDIKTDKFYCQKCDRYKSNELLNIAIYVELKKQTK
jgi:hypothetical protein